MPKIVTHGDRWCLEKGELEGQKEERKSESVRGESGGRREKECVCGARGKEGTGKRAG